MEDPPKTGSEILNGRGNVFSLNPNSGSIIKKCAKYANLLGIDVHAGHGLDYKSARLLSNIKEISELNIGHFIIGESIFDGLKKVIKKFKKICK